MGKIVVGHDIINDFRAIEYIQNVTFETRMSHVVSYICVGWG